MKLLFLLPMSVCFVQASRPWNEWEMTEIKGTIHYYPWHCCQMCGDGEEWRHYSYSNGRCIYSNSTDRHHDYSSNDERFAPKVRYWFMCCYFCGNQAGDYVFEEITADNLEEYIGLDDGNQDEKVFNKVFMSNAFQDKTLKFLAKYRLIANERFCQDCKRDEMTLVKAADRPDGYIWRCAKCRRDNIPGLHRISLRHGSFFDNSQLSLENILKLAAWWSDHPEDIMDSVKEVFGFSKTTIVDYYNFFRDICQDWYVRKVDSGTTIISDSWAAYGGIAQLNAGFVHMKVNHKYNFVDPATGAHTQSIEATWGALKRSLKHLYGTSESLLPTYMYQYMFRRANGKKKLFQHLLNEMSITFDVYDGN